MANTLFQDYQKQAARGEIQFRRWPLRAVSLLFYTSSLRSYPDSHHQHKCMGSLCYLLELFSTAPHQAEDSCCRITFLRTVSSAYVALRMAGRPQIDALCSRFSLPGLLRMLFHATWRADVSVVYRRSRTHDPSGGWCRRRARCAGLDQDSYRDHSRKRGPVQRSSERCLYGEAEDGSKCLTWYLHLFSAPYKNIVTNVVVS
jgi:hypothetical protein